MALIQCKYFPFYLNTTGTIRPFQLMQHTYRQTVGVRENRTWNLWSIAKALKDSAKVGHITDHDVVAPVHEGCICRSINSAEPTHIWIDSRVSLHHIDRRLLRPVPAGLPFLVELPPVLRPHGTLCVVELLLILCCFTPTKSSFRSMSTNLSLEISYFL